MCEVFGQKHAQSVSAKVRQKGHQKRAKGASKVCVQHRDGCKTTSISMVRERASKACAQKCAKARQKIALRSALKAFTQKRVKSVGS